MDFNRNASIYLTKISAAAMALSSMIGCDLKPEAVHKITVALLELEQSTADFICDMGISDAGAKVCRERFVKTNIAAIQYLEKIQLQGYNFTELITALKLEIETLNKEQNFA